MDYMTPYSGSPQQSEKPAPKPTKMPNLGYGGKSVRPKATNSVISTAEAINIVAILKQELQKVDCVLRDFYVRKHARGVDVDKIKIFSAHTNDLRQRVRDMDPDGEVPHDRRNRITSLALMVVNHKVRKRMEEELNLDAALYDYDDVDLGVMSVTVPSSNPDPEEMDEAPFGFPPTEPGPEETFPPPEEEGATPPPGGEEEVYSPEDEEMDLGGVEEEQGAPPLPGEEGALPGAIRPEDEVGNPRAVPDLL